jgi:hypothetical protein
MDGAIADTVIAAAMDITVAITVDAVTVMAAVDTTVAVPVDALDTAADIPATAMAVVPDMVDIPVTVVDIPDMVAHRTGDLTADVPVAVAM